jgi:hypothetical protein
MSAQTGCGCVFDSEGKCNCCFFAAILRNRQQGLDADSRFKAGTGFVGMTNQEMPCWDTSFRRNPVPDTIQGRNPIRNVAMHRMSCMVSIFHHPSSLIRAAPSAK